MARVIHPVAGALAFLTISTFWLSTVLTELLGRRDRRPPEIRSMISRRARYSEGPCVAALTPGSR